MYSLAIFGFLSLIKSRFWRLEIVMPQKNEQIDPIVLYLVQERLRQRMTQKQMAERSCIPFRTYQRIEQGRSEITIMQVRQIINVFRLTWLDVARREVGIRQAEIDEIAVLLKHIPVNLRQSLLSIVKAISEELNKKKKTK